LERLTELKPGQRGSRVRVIQDTGDKDLHPDNEGWYAYGEKPPNVGWADAATEGEDEDDWGWEEEDQGLIWIHHHHYGPLRSVRRVRIGPHRGGPGFAKGVLGKASRTGAKAQDEEAAAVIVVLAAIAITVSLAATEGARYDGWVAVDPNHPIHLNYDDGGKAVGWLSGLRPGDLSGLSSAYLIEDEGNGFKFIKRAPLYRKGGSWKLELGVSEVNLGNDTSGMGWAARMHLGLFASDMVGMGLTLKYDGGDALGGDYFNLHYGVDLHLMPLRVKTLHAGVFGGAGMGYIVAGGGSLSDFEQHSFGYEAGGVLEWELNTRLAVSARFGTSWYHRSSGLENAGWFALAGLSIY
jgi:hypothetical protein